ncbi:Uncharacterised protein [Mycobacteroides abscessus subsp. massiliense]|nr:Uncharacterised protein [Mycobacteroides abscessus subsp. massiliense]
MDQGVAIAIPGGPARGGQTRNVTVSAHIIARIAHGGQQRHRARWGVQSHRIPDPCMLGGIRGEDHGDPALTGRYRSKFCVPQGNTRHPRATLRVGNIGDEPVAVYLLEGERHGDDASVEFRDRHLSGDIQRAHAVVVGVPILTGAGQTQSLQDRDIKSRKMSHAPFIIGSPGAHGRRNGTAGRQHRDHHGVGGRECLQQLRRGSTQRRAVHRKSVPAMVFDGRAQGIDVRGVSGELLGAVVQHRDRGAVRRGTRAVSFQHSPRGVGRGRFESDAGHQDGVRQEGVQLAQVRRPAFGQVPVHLQRHPTRDGRTFHQLGVGCLLSGDDDGRYAGCDNRVDALFPAATPAEQPNHHGAHPVKQAGQVVDEDARRVGPPVVRSAGARTQQVGVGRRQDQDRGIAHKTLVP